MVHLHVVLLLFILVLLVRRLEKAFHDIKEWRRHLPSPLSPSPSLSLLWPEDNSNIIKSFSHGKIFLLFNFPIVRRQQKALFADAVVVVGI